MSLRTAQKLFYCVFLVVGLYSIAGCSSAGPNFKSQSNFSSDKFYGFSEDSLTDRPLFTIDSPSFRSSVESSGSIYLVSDGLASWYGKRRHQHRRTASGEKFDRLAFTAAHRTLPFGSHVLVRNLKTGDEVVVRINDRGPVSRRRVIDVSYAAGHALGMLRRGTAHVSIESIQ
jgi:hypothetical protein